MSENVSLKGLILCAGKGTRLRPLTDSIPKPLIPVNNRPMVFYVIDRAVKAGVTDIGIVVSPATADAVKDSVGSGTAWGARITYIMQEQTHGLAHAVKVSRPFLGDSGFLMLLGDNLLEDNIGKLIAEFKQYKPAATVLLKEVPDPRHFGVAELDDSGRVIRFEEKPKDPRSNLALTGLYLFTPQIHDMIDLIKPSWRGEYEITDAIQQLLDHHREVRSVILPGWWLDAGNKADLLLANRTLLADIEKNEISGQADGGTVVSGQAVIGAGTVLDDCTITGPVSIGENCSIKNTSIGPFVSLGAETKITDARIENSLILAGCRLHHVRLSDCILGEHVEISGNNAGKSGMTVFLGSYCKIDV